VPEQVNIPVDMVKELRIDAKYNIDLQVLSVPEGTGKMLTMLENGEADIAMTVSDAFIVANAKGRAVELVGTWVSSPLVWAVAASPALPKEVTSVSALYAHRQKLTGDHACKLRVGISRPGSGSQTMATYMAMLHELDYEHGLEFVVANNFDNLKRGICEDAFDLFLWETFTTKPDFDANILRKLDDVSTPWPAFSLVAGTSLSSRLRSAAVDRLFPALTEAAMLFVKDEETSVAKIVTEFGHQSQDARLWLSSVAYNIEVAVGNGMQYVDEHKGNSLMDDGDSCFRSKQNEFLRSQQGLNEFLRSQQGLQTIPVDVYATSVRILQSVGLVPMSFGVQTLWPSQLVSSRNVNASTFEVHCRVPTAVATL
jgi:hypothetical protein